MNKANNLYENNEMYSLDGKLMFFGKKKRVDWYLKRGLAKKIGHKKYQFLFETKGDGEPDKYLKKRRNLCVVSGETENLTKHHVVPYMYRKHFPLEYKDKNSYDLVLLTDEIHSNYEREADKLKKELEDRYITDEERQVNKDIDQYNKVSKVLKKHLERLPVNALESLSQEFKELRLKEAYKLERIDFNKLIVDRVGVENLIIMWKNHFVDTAKPKHLPKWWNPNDIKKIKR